MISFITLGAVGLLTVGLQPNVISVGAGFFALLFCVPMASGPSQAIFQSKVAPGVQGRVFATRSMISRSMTPLAFLTAGPLADFIFEPAMQEGGALANTALGAFLGVGAGRGIGLMFVASGMTLFIASILVLANPRIRRIETELADAVPDAPPQQLSTESSPALA